MKISILGCGWLGLALAKHLVRRNHLLKGSTTAEEKVDELRSHYIEPYIIDLSPEIENPKLVQEFWNSHILVLNIPPGRKRADVVNFHTRQIQNIIDHVEGGSIQHVIFASSTSVYPPSAGLVYEENAIPGKASRPSGNALLEAEMMLRRSTHFATTILRFGGLFGANRHPVKYMAGRKNIGKANAPVNLIHRDDCIAIITQIIEEHIRGETFNAVSDGHPPRKKYYTEIAKQQGLEPPTFRNEATNNNYKTVSNEKIKKLLSYSFIHPVHLQ